MVVIPGWHYGVEIAEINVVSVKENDNCIVGEALEGQYSYT